MAKEDTAVSVADARSLEQQAGSRDKRLIVLPAAFGHGWNIVTQGDGSPTTIGPVVLHFLQSHAGS